MKKKSLTGLSGSRAQQTTFVLLVILSLIAVGATLYLTRFGPKIGGDSVRYVMGAENLLAGDGYSRNSGGGELKPITGFPPGFSISIATVGVLGEDIYQSARFLNALLFGINLFLSGMLLNKAKIPHWITLIGVLLLLVSENLFIVHGWVMSEPLYLTLSLLFFLCLLTYLNDPKWGWLVLSGVVAGFATLTRLSGFGLIGVAMLSIGLLLPARWVDRAKSLAVFLVLSVGPIAGWLIPRSLQSGSLANRVITFHAIRSELVDAYLREITFWFTPAQLSLPFRPRVLILALILFGLPTLLIAQDLNNRRKGIHNGRRNSVLISYLLFGYTISFLAILFINSTFLDAGTTLSAPSRYLVPLYLNSVLLGIIVIWELVRQITHQRWIQILVSMVGGLLILLNISPTFELLNNPLPAMGYTYFQQTWNGRETETQEIHPDRTVISNNPELTYFIYGIGAYMWPQAYDSYRMQEREDYEEQVLFAKKILETGGILVVYGSPDDAEIEMLEDIGVVKTRSLGLATYYEAKEPK